MKVRTRPLWVPPEPVPCEDDPIKWTNYPTRTERRDPVRVAEVENAKNICNTKCQFRDKCLAEILADEGGRTSQRRELNGIRGGKTPGQRQAIHKKRVKENKE